LDSWVSSRDETQARLFIDDCRLFGSILADAGKCLGVEVLAAQSRQSSLALNFANGTTIHSLSSHPDAQAGKRGTRVLDEFALHSDARTLYAIAAPGITWGGQLEILSTHRGSLSFFNELVQEARFNGNGKGFSLHRITLQDALDQGFLQKLQRKLPDGDPRRDMDEAQYFDFIRKSCPDEATFQQEYMCQPMDDRSAFLPFELIDSCEFAPSEPWQIAMPPQKNSAVQLSNPCYLGVDLGHDHDLTVFWLLELVGDIFLTRRVECLCECTFSVQERHLENFFAIPQLRRVCIDRTGMGCQFAERAVQRFGPMRAEGVTLSAPVKESLAYSLRSAFEASVLRIPPSDEIRADLHSVRREISRFGNLRLCAERGKYGHGDRFWALALALHAAHAAIGDGRYGTEENFYVVERQHAQFFL
jgi:phage FluMu gp28-like protein